VQGKFCESPLQCVDEICVHPGQLDGTGGGDPSGQGEGDATLSASGSASATGNTSASASGGMDEASASAGDDGMGETGGDSGTTSTTGATATDATATDATAGECVPPECNAYATKMAMCYPMLGLDWYAECLEVADICHIDGPCLTPETVSCAIAMPCEVVVDGGCVDDAC
jgi:hypothetical protein